MRKMNNNPCKKCLVDPMCEKPCASFIEYIKPKILINYNNRPTWIWIGRHLKTGRIEFCVEKPGWRWIK